jgi:hypothetical protein
MVMIANEVRLARMKLTRLKEFVGDVVRKLRTYVEEVRSAPWSSDNNTHSTAAVIHLVLHCF